VIDVWVENGSPQNHARWHVFGIIRAESDLDAVQIAFLYGALFGLGQTSNVIIDDVPVGRIAGRVYDADALVVRKEHLEPLILGVQSSKPYTHVTY